MQYSQPVGEAGCLAQLRGAGWVWAQPVLGELREGEGDVLGDFPGPLLGAWKVPAVKVPIRGRQLGYLSLSELCTAQCCPA